MKKLTKEEYRRKQKATRKLQERQNRKREARLSKSQQNIKLVVPERKPGQDAPCAFMVRKQRKGEE